MSNVIYGNMVGGGAAPLKTLILEDESGNTITGVVVGSEVIFTATDNDVREGMVYASDNGVSTGTKNIPAYRTHKGDMLVMPGDSFSVQLSQYNKYDYTKFQCLISKFNTSFEDSVCTDRISINDCVYNSNSTEVLSHVTKNNNNKSIDLNIDNDTEDIYVIHYFTCKEEV